MVINRSILKIYLNLIEANVLTCIGYKCSFIQSYYMIIVLSYFFQIKFFIIKRLVLRFKKLDIISKFCYYIQTSNSSMILLA